MRRAKASKPCLKDKSYAYMTFAMLLHFLPVGSFKEAFSRPEGPYRYPMPWDSMSWDSMSWGGGKND